MLKNMLRHFIFILIIAVPVVAILLELKTQHRSVANNFTQEDLMTQKLNFDLGTPNPNELTRTIKFRILQELSLRSENNNYKFQFGHFNYNLNNETIIGCNKFKFIEIILNAEGIATSGDTPKIAFTIPCDASSNPEFIESPVIPLGEIAQLPVTQKEWVDSISNIHFYFISMTEMWPTEWALYSLTFFTPGIDEKIKISGAELLAVLQTVPVISLE